MIENLPIIQRSAISPHLSIASLMEPVADAFRAVYEGRSQFNIDVLHPTDFSDLHVKSAIIQGTDVFTVKLAGWSSKNEAAGLPSSSGLILVFDAASCRPIAILQDDHLISDLRTAAAGALSVKLLANPEATSLAVIGAGEQAYQQIQAIKLVRDISKISVWNRTPDRAKALVSRLQKEDSSIDVKTVDTTEEAVTSAEIIVTATASREPIIKAHWLRAGMHITSIGSDDTTKCELEPECLAIADQLVVDSQVAAVSYGNAHRAIKTGAIKQDQLTEIGEFLSKEVSGRQKTTDITIATFVGLGVQDLMATSTLRRALSF